MGMDSDALVAPPVRRLDRIEHACIAAASRVTGSGHVDPKQIGSKPAARQAVLTARPMASPMGRAPGQPHEAVVQLRRTSPDPASSAAVST
jgi:hypothetical protein